MLENLRKQGRFKYNRDQGLHNGNIIVARRSKIDNVRTDKDYTTCVVCKDTISKRTIHKHYRECAGKESKDRYVKAYCRLAEDRIHPTASLATRQTLCRLREDEVGDIIRFDTLLIAWANNLTIKYKLTQEQDMIRNRLRLVARLLLAIQKLCPKIKDLADVFYPWNFYTVIEAVNVVAGLNSEGDAYATASNASSLGTYIKKLAVLLRSLCVRRNDCERISLIGQFVYLMEHDYPIKIGRTVQETQIRNECNKRRRPGETERMPLENFLNRKSISCKTDAELFNSLSKRIAY